MESENNPNYVGLIFLGIIKYLFASFFIFILLMLMNNNPGSGGSYRNMRKSCFSNIRLLNGATEMYNMDNSAKINELNNSTIKILIDNKYLKKKLYCFDLPENEYKSKGDISKDGFIFCELHGNLDQSYKGKNSEEDDQKLFIEAKAKAKNEKMHNCFIFSFKIGLIVFILELIRIFSMTK